MAKRKKSRSATRTINRTQIVRTPAPIVRVSAPRAAPVKRKSYRRRRGGSVGGGGGMSRVRALASPAMAGGAVGLLIKSGMIDKLPEIPVFGRIGTAAIGMAYFGGGGGIIYDMAKGLAFLSGYQLSTEGKIHGDEDDGMVYVDDGQG